MLFRFVATALALAALLSSCAFFPPQPGENGTVRLGVRVLYILKDSKDFAFCASELVGCTVPFGSVCVVQLDKTYFEKGTPWQKVNLVSHELGHCLDMRKLSLSHGGFHDEGKRWGAYYAQPVEGFAEAYAHAYIAKCGLDLDSLGWLNARGKCALPDPRAVTPQLIQKLEAR